MKEKLKIHDGDTPGKVFEVKLEYPKPKVETMSDTEIRSMHYTIEQLSAELQATKQYVSDIKSKLERTRKALDVAVDALKSAHKYYQNCVIREKQPHEINWYCTAMNMDNDISEAIKQITTLEQKE